MRVLGIDVGRRRVGLAISDPSGTLARPLTTLTVTSAADAVDRVAAEVTRLASEDDGLAAIVVGVPARLDGSPTDETPACRRVHGRARRARFGADRRRRRAVDEPRSGKPAGGRRTRLAACERRSSTRRPPRSSCRIISIKSGFRLRALGLGLAEPGAQKPGARNAYEETRASLSCLLVIAAGAAGVWIYLRVGEPYRGYESAEQFVEIPPARAAARSAIAWWPPASFATRCRFASACTSRDRDAACRPASTGSIAP